jgi:hypothetical protein
MQEWGQYGILGLVVAGLVGYILRIEARHKTEREDAKKTEKEQFNRLNQISDETNKVLRENTSILSGLKTLLENRK